MNGLQILYTTGPLRNVHVQKFKTLKVKYITPTSAGVWTVLDFLRASWTITEVRAFRSAKSLAQLLAIQITH